MNTIKVIISIVIGSVDLAPKSVKDITPANPPFFNVEKRIKSIRSVLSYFLFF